MHVFSYLSLLPLHLPLSLLLLVQHPERELVDMGLKSYREGGGEIKRGGREDIVREREGEREIKRRERERENPSPSALESSLPLGIIVPHDVSHPQHHSAGAESDEDAHHYNHTHGHWPLVQVVTEERERGGREKKGRIIQKSNVVSWRDIYSCLEYICLVTYKLT